MPLEPATFINDLAITNPTGADNRSQGDDHMRLIKSVLKTTLPGASRAFPFPLTLAKNADFTVQTTEENTTYLVDTSVATRTATLPTAVGRIGFSVVFVKTTAANSLVIDGSGAETVRGAANVTLTDQWASVTVQSDGSNWQVIAEASGLFNISDVAFKSQANIFTTGQTITGSTGSFTALKVISTSADGAAGPAITLFRDAVAAGAQRGVFNFTGRNNLGTEVAYGHIFSSITDGTTGAHSGSLTFVPVTGAGFANQLVLNGASMAWTGAFGSIGGSNIITQATLAAAIAAAGSLTVNGNLTVTGTVTAGS